MTCESAVKAAGLHLVAATAIVAIAGLMPLNAPAAAYAQEDPGSTPLSGLATQSVGKTSLWVVVGRIDDGNADKVVSKFAYNSNGLVKSIKSPIYSSSIKYSGLLETSSTFKVNNKGFSSTTKAKLEHDESGRLEKVVLTKSGAYADGEKFSYNGSEAYTYDSKGRLVKLVEHYGDALRTTHKYSKFDKQGRPQRETIKESNATSAYQAMLKYDSHGNLKFYGSGKSGELALKYDSKNRLVSSIRTSMNKGYRFTYKKIAVPKNAVAAVKRQQLEIMNPNLPSVCLIAHN